MQIYPLLVKGFSDSMLSLTVLAAVVAKKHLSIHCAPAET